MKKGTPVSTCPICGADGIIHVPNEDETCFLALSKTDELFYVSDAHSNVVKVNEAMRPFYITHTCKFTKKTQKEHSNV